MYVFTVMSLFFFHSNSLIPSSENFPTNIVSHYKIDTQGWACNLIINVHLYIIRYISVFVANHMVADSYSLLLHLYNANH